MHMACHIPNRVLNVLLALAKQHNIEKILLFGSRARGTNGERSDIDIAVSGGNYDAFFADVKEKMPTLISFDVVRLDEKTPSSLLAEIRRDGVTIYEKT